MTLDITISLLFILVVVILTLDDVHWKRNHKNDYLDGFRDAMMINEQYEISDDTEAMLREVKKSWIAYLKATDNNVDMYRGDIKRINEAETMEELAKIMREQVAR